MKLFLLLLHLLSLFFLHTPMQQSIAYKLAAMPLRKDPNAGITSSTPNSTATIQVPATQVPPMTQEQNKLLFELIRRKLKAELAAAQVEARFKRKLMVKESKARVAAAVAAASTTAGAQVRMSTAEEDDITSEVPSEVTSITLRFAGLPQEEIIRIFLNKFKPINLYRLCQIRGLRFDALQDHDRIGIEDGLLRLRKTWRVGGCLPQLHHHSCFPVQQRGPRPTHRPRQILQQRLRALHSLWVARRSLPDGHRGPNLHRLPATHRPVEVGHPEEVPG